MKILAVEIAKNTNLSAKEDSSGLWAWITSWFKSKKSTDTGGNTEPEKEFRPLFAFVGTKEQAEKAPVETYRNELGNLYNGLNGMSADQFRQLPQDIQNDSDKTLKLKSHETVINGVLKSFNETPAGQDLAAMLLEPLTASIIKSDLAAVGADVTVQALEWQTQWAQGKSSNPAKRQDIFLFYWYPDYADTEAWGLSALEDQQLGGLIMWIPACLVYVFAGLALFAAWLRDSERRVARREARDLLVPAAAGK